MSKEIINTGILAALFLLLFLFAELLYHKGKLKAEITRKIVHAGTGMLTLLFPILLANKWFVLLLCTSFALILILSIKFTFLKSINSIDRISYGSILYPVAVFGCYLVYDYFGKTLLFFYLPVLTLAICDPVAAMAGKRWPVAHLGVGKSKKTITGFGAFFISSVVITILLFHLLSTEKWNNILGLALLIALISSLTEVVSNSGIDNITIPASVILILIFYR